MQNQNGISPASEQFLSGAYRRIHIASFILSAVAALAAHLIWDARVAAGLLLGALVSWINFVWLKQSMVALTDRVAAGSEVPEKPGSRKILFKFIFRYVILAALAYVIISSLPVSVYGLLAGLFVSVAALLFESVCEMVFALRHEE